MNRLPPRIPFSPFTIIRLLNPWLPEPPHDHWDAHHAQTAPNTLRSAKVVIVQYRGRKDEESQCQENAPHDGSGYFQVSHSTPFTEIKQRGPEEFARAWHSSPLWKDEMCGPGGGLFSRCRGRGERRWNSLIGH